MKLERARTLNQAVSARQTSIALLCTSFFAMLCSVAPNYSVATIHLQWKSAGCCPIGAPRPDREHPNECVEKHVRVNVKEEEGRGVSDINN